MRKGYGWGGVLWAGLGLCAGCPEAPPPEPAVAVAAAPEPTVQGRSLSAWRADLDASESATRRAALAVFAERRGRPAATGIPQLSEGLRSADARVREDAALDLALAGEAALPVLSEALGGEDKAGAVAARRALVWVGAPAVPALREALAGSHPGARWLAIQALGQLGPDARPALEGLTQLLRGEETALRLPAAQALAGLGPPGAAELAGALRDSRVEVRRAAATGLGLVGESVLPVLLDFLADDVVREGVQAGVALSGRPAGPALAAALERPPPIRDWCCATAEELDAVILPLVAELGATERAIAEAIQRIHDSDPDARAAALAELIGLGEAALPALEHLAGDEHPEVRAAAEEGLRALRGGVE